jgi:hypothetical protein
VIRSTTRVGGKCGGGSAAPCRSHDEDRVSLALTLESEGYVTKGRLVQPDQHAVTFAYRHRPGGRTAELGYDRLVIAVGSVNKLLPIPGVSEHAHGFRGAYLRRCTCATRDPPDGIGRCRRRSGRAERASSSRASARSAVASSRSCGTSVRRLRSPSGPGGRRRSAPAARRTAGRAVRAGTARCGHVALYCTEVGLVSLRRPLARLVDLLAAIPSGGYGFWAVFALVPAQPRSRARGRTVPPHLSPPRRSAQVGPPPQGRRAQPMRVNVELMESVAVFSVLGVHV